jgi:replicative DNA helicase
MVVVDHVHELADPGGRGEDTVASRMAGIMGRLKGLAKDLRCVLVAVAQTNRQGRRAEREPELSDLRDSAAIEDKASVVLFIHHGKDRAGRMRPARLLVAKHRNGAGGARIDLLWDSERAMFRSVARMEAPPGRRGDDPDADR